MALWQVTKKNGEKFLTHFNRLNGRSFECGRVEDLSEQKVVEWVVQEARPLDVVLLDGGIVLVISRELGARA